MRGSNGRIWTDEQRDKLRATLARKKQIRERAAKAELGRLAAGKDRQAERPDETGLIIGPLKGIESDTAYRIRQATGLVSSFTIAELAALGSHPEAVTAAVDLYRAAKVLYGALVDPNDD